LGQITVTPAVADPGRAALDAIGDLLDGEEWTPETLDRIAGHCRDAGRAIADTADRTRRRKSQSPRTP
jgi:hypothetical protein